MSSLGADQWDMIRDHQGVSAVGTRGKKSVISDVIKHTLMRRLGKNWGYQGMGKD